MVYTYTKARGPIAAMYTSPGPCYALPSLIGKSAHDPRSVHNRAPSYPFGVRHRRWTEDCSPGPCHYPDSKVYQNGRDGTPHYSLYGRQRDLTPFKTPGPGAYTPERAGPCSKPMMPSYSFGSRNRHKRSDNTPAPNSYSLPSMLGKTIQSRKAQAPCYSMTGRSTTGSFHEDLQKTPGPGCYNVTDTNNYYNRQPIYSMTSRNVMPGDTTQKPGPGAHSPEMINKTAAPSFGIRHSEYLTPLIISELVE